MAFQVKSSTSHDYMYIINYDISLYDHNINILSYYMITIYHHDYVDADLIFVTDSRTVSVEKKSVMWRNFKFLYMTNVEKSKIHPPVD